MALTMDSTLGDLMTDEAALKMFGERYPGALDDPNLKNSRISRSPKRRGASMAFSTKSKLGEVLDHPEGAKIMEEYIPGCSTDPDPMIKVARGMTLLNISQLASDKLPASVLDELNEKLQAIAD